MVVGVGDGLGVGDDDGFGAGADVCLGAEAGCGVGVGLLDGAGAEAIAGPAGPPTICVIVPSSAATSPASLPFMPSAHAPMPRRWAAFAKRALSAREDASS